VRDDGTVTEVADRPEPALGDATRTGFRGVNHLALVTPDMDATVRFWAGVLGCPLVATVGTPQFRHYFFEIGEGSTVAFFEYATAPVAAFAKPAGVPDARAIQFDHLSLDLPDEEALVALAARLRAAECEVTELVDHGFIRSIYFTDPSGIALEASYWVNDATAPARADFADPRLFADEDPVPAVAELAEGGRLTSTPRTALS